MVEMEKSLFPNDCRFPGSLREVLSRGAQSFPESEAGLGTSLGLVPGVGCSGMLADVSQLALRVGALALVWHLLISVV